MHNLLVDVLIKHQHKGVYIKGIVEQAKATLAAEPDCLRFDIIENANDPNTLHVYEVFRDEAALALHRAGASHTSFMGHSKDWHAKPAHLRVCKDVFLSAQGGR